MLFCTARYTVQTLNRAVITCRHHCECASYECRPVPLRCVKARQHHVSITCWSTLHLQRFRSVSVLLIFAVVASHRILWSWPSNCPFLHTSRWSKRSFSCAVSHTPPSSCSSSLLSSPSPSLCFHPASSPLLPGHLLWHQARVVSMEFDSQWVGGKAVQMPSVPQRQ